MFLTAWKQAWALGPNTQQKTNSTKYCYSNKLHVPLGYGPAGLLQSALDVKAGVEIQEDVQRPKAHGDDGEHLQKSCRHAVIAQEGRNVQVPGNDHRQPQAPRRTFQAPDFDSVFSPKSWRKDSGATFFPVEGGVVASSHSESQLFFGHGAVCDAE